MKILPILCTALLSCFALHPSNAAKGPILWDYPYVLAVPDGLSVQLLQDQAFTNGFRAFWSCKTFPNDVAALGHIGECTDYFTPFANTQGKHYEVHTWPDTGAPNDVGKYWNFNESIHAGFSLYGYLFPLELPPPDPRNYPVPNPSPCRPVGETELGGHRLEGNRETSYGIVGGLYGVGPNLIWLQSMNNLSPSDPHWQGLVRTVSSNRAGEIMMYMNTENEMRNVATGFGSNFAYDGWPFFQLEQNFKKVIDLATLGSAMLQFNVELPLAENLSPVPGGNWYSIDFTAGYMLRRKNNPPTVVFLGYPLYSTFAPNLDGRFFVDQFGSAAYSGNVADLGGKVQPAQSGPGVHNPANYRQISFELRTLMNKALAYAASFSYLNDGDPSNDYLEPGRLAFLQYTLDDYYLASFGIGWETMGYQHVQSYISGVSLYGSPRMIFDSEVYQESTSAYQPSTYKALNNLTGSEGQARAHWAKIGSQQGLVASTTFNVNIYIARWGGYMPQCYQHGTWNYECAIDHYVLFGRAAQHWGHW